MRPRTRLGLLFIKIRYAVTTSGPVRVRYRPEFWMSLAVGACAAPTRGSHQRQNPNQQRPSGRLTSLDPHYFMHQQLRNPSDKSGNRVNTRTRRDDVRNGTERIPGPHQFRSSFNIINHPEFHRRKKDRESGTMVATTDRVTS